MARLENRIEEALAPIPMQPPADSGDRTVHLAELGSPEPRERRRLALLLGRISRSNEMRRAMLGLIEGARPKLDDIDPLVAALRQPRRYYREREAAAWALNSLDLTPEQNDAAALALGDVIENRVPKDRWRAIRAALRPTTATVPVALLLYATAYATSDRIVTWMILPVMFALIHAVTLPVLGPIFHAMHVHRVNRVRATALDALGRLGRIETLSIAARAYSDTSPGVRAAAAQALLRTLPLVSEEQRGRLDSDTVPNLCRVLEHWDVELAVSVVRILEQVGDSRAIPAVQRVAEHGSTSQLRQSAKRTLAALQARQEQERDTHLLLRAAPTAADDALLRPAKSSADAAEGFLLHPVEDAVKQP